ncbi:MerR family transcriptional regulator [Deinococcus pimensis]|uniref:MerR family transcriptional regulator n=1 Tax=Deinococcus pimensis TaxID=309888 RepID=UPI00048A41C3|nr:MerR family transcriptional regulator [Deinococcus pimensis]
MTTFSINEAAERSGVSPHTLRYYERIGLLDSPARAAGGQRRYVEADLMRVAFLRRLRATGMSIQEMRAFVTLTREGDASVAARCALLEAHEQAVQQRLLRLSGDLEAIRAKIAHYKTLG